MIVLALAGPEKLGHKFGVAHDSDMYDAAGDDAVAAVLHRREAMGNDADEYAGEKKAVPSQRELMA